MVVKSFRISSAQRTSGTATNFTYTLSKDLTTSSATFMLLEAHIPLTFYNIKSQQTIATSLGNVVMVAGNYSKQSAITQLQTLLQVLNPNFAATLNQNTLLTTISNTIIFSLNFSGAQSLASILGFGTTPLAGQASYLASGVGSVLPSNLIVIIPELGLPGIAATASSSYTFNIPVPPYVRGDWIVYTANTTYYQTVDGNRAPLYTMHVVLADEAGSPIELNGADFSLLIGVC